MQRVSAMFQGIRILPGDQEALAVGGDIGRAARNAQADAVGFEAARQM